MNDDERDSEEERAQAQHYREVEQEGPPYEAISHESIAEKIQVRYFPDEPLTLDDARHYIADWYAHQPWREHIGVLDDDDLEKIAQALADEDATKDDFNAGQPITGYVVADAATGETHRTNMGTPI